MTDRPTPEQTRMIRSELWELLCRHMDTYPNASPYNALRATFNKHARRHSKETDDE